MQDLLNHIKAANEKTRAWVAEDPKNRWSGLYPEDEAYWIERGISTVAELERDELITYIYDGHKSAYGFRNRGYDFDSMSLAELEAEADRISEAIDQANKEQDAYYKHNIKKLEEQIAETQSMGAASREDAIRWILQAENLINEYDVDYISYSLGVPYDHMKSEFEKVVQAC